jgi:hypothetical protein
VVEAKVSLRFVERALNSLRRPDLRPAWKEARAPLRADIKDHRQKQAGPSGAWAGRAESTRERRQYAGRRPRKLLGKLPTALSTISDRRRVAMRSRVAWSEVQRSGGTVGHGAKIPARDFLWASQQVLGTIAGIVSAYLSKLWSKAS